MNDAPFLGVLMLDTRFPRPPGDIGNPQTFARAGVPVRFKTVHGASAKGVVQKADPSLYAPFLNAAKELVQQGAGLITTSCGFLAAYQSAFETALSVPVITSGLLLCEKLHRPGIVTFDHLALGPSILGEAKVPPGTPISGLATGCHMQSTILNDLPVMNLARAQADVVAAALALIDANPDVENIVLECTNMPPYREAVRHATGRTVHDIETFLVQQWHANYT